MNYFKVDSNLIIEFQKKEVSEKGRVIYTLLGCFINRNNSSICEFTYSELMDATGISSKQTISKGLKELCEKGFMMQCHNPRNLTICRLLIGIFKGFSSTLSEPTGTPSEPDMAVTGTVSVPLYKEVTLHNKNNSKHVILVCDKKIEKLKKYVEILERKRRHTKKPIDCPSSFLAKMIQNPERILWYSINQIVDNHENGWKSIDQNSGSEPVFENKNHGKLMNNIREERFSSQ